MFKRILLPAALLVAAVSVFYNRKKLVKLPLIGDTAPKFSANSTKGMINFPRDYKGHWVVFFSHPADFTPVCTTEFMTFESMKDDFEKLNTKLLGLSIDSVSSHLAWLKNIRDKIDYKGMSEIDVDFPLIDDLNKSIAKKYGMLQPNADETKTVRAVFIIDPKGKIRAVLYYPQTNGRNIDEILRLLKALQTTDDYQVATPANWEKGDDVIILPPANKQEALERLEKMDDIKCYDWFLCFKKLPESNTVNDVENSESQHC